nr:MAG TPA: hypothetical protein [Caudoviricetes sp.]
MTCTAIFSTVLTHCTASYSFCFIQCVCTIIIIASTISITIESVKIIIVKVISITFTSVTHIYFLLTCY